MADYRTLFEEALRAWSATRRNVIAELENIPEQDYDYRPSADARSVAELGHHIAGAGLVFAGELTRPDGDFSRQALQAFHHEYSGHLAQPASKADLLELLRATHVELDDKLRAAGVDHMLENTRGLTGRPVSRFSMLQFGIAHEAYHCGQITVHARNLGLVPALTQRFQPA